MPTSHFLKFLFDLILPPRCFGCGEEVSDHHKLCSACWKKCTFLSFPWCHLCGRPFPFETYEKSLCPSCFRQKPLFLQGRSALAYDEGSRGLILKFKQGDGTHLAPGLSQFMIQAGQDILEKTDALIPVPLHWRRLFLRQYNQATLLSQNISKHTHIPTLTYLLKRHRPTKKQGYQSKKARHENVKGAFMISSHQKHLLKNKRLTLIDDVFTTGATLKECTKTLLKGGAKEVRVLTLARVIMPL